MAITADNFNKVVVYINSRSPFPISSIIAYQDDTRIGHVPFLDGKQVISILLKRPMNMLGTGSMMTMPHMNITLTTLITPQSQTYPTS